MALFFGGIIAVAAWPMREVNPGLYYQVVLATAGGIALVTWFSDRRSRRQRSTWLKLAEELGWSQTVTENLESAIEGRFEGFLIRAHYAIEGRHAYTWLKLQCSRPLLGELTIAGKETTWGQGFLDVQLGDDSFDQNYGFKGNLDGETIRSIFSSELRASLERTRSDAARLLTGQGVPLITVSGQEIVYRVAGRLADKQNFLDHLQALTGLARQCERHMAGSAQVS